LYFSFAWLGKNGSLSLVGCVGGGCESSVLHAVGDSAAMRHGFGVERFCACMEQLLWGAMLVGLIGVAAYIFVGKDCLMQLGISLYGASGDGPFVFWV
jgi:hypothetical protein